MSDEEAWGDFASADATAALPAPKRDPAQPLTPIEQDAAFTNAVVAALIPAPDAGSGNNGVRGGGGIPLLPLVRLILTYALPFRCAVTTLKPKAASDALKCPTAVCVFRTATDEDGSGGVSVSYLVADSDRAAFVRVFDDGRAVPFVSWPPHLKYGTARAIRVDPTNPNRLFVALTLAVLSVEVQHPPPAANSGGAPTTAVALIAGGTSSGGGYAVAAVGSAVQFNAITDLCVADDGRTVYVSDYGTGLRRVDVASKRVTSVEPSAIATSANWNIANAARSVCIDRLPRRHPPPSLPAGQSASGREGDAAAAATPAAAPVALIVAALQCLLRVDCHSSTPRIEHLHFASASPAPGSPPLTAGVSPEGVYCTASGLLLFTCAETRALYAFDRRSATGTGFAGRTVELLAGGGGGDPNEAVAGAVAGDDASERDGLAGDARFAQPTGLDVDEPGRYVVIADTQNKSIRRVTLSPLLFDPPSAARADSQ